MKNDEDVEKMKMTLDDDEALVMETIIKNEKPLELNRELANLLATARREAKQEVLEIIQSNIEYIVSFRTEDSILATSLLKTIKCIRDELKTESEVDNEKA